MRTIISSRIKILSLIIFAVIFQTWTVQAALQKESLSIKFDRPQTIVGGQNSRVELGGHFTPDGYWQFGKKGLAIPAHGLLGDAGTVVLRFRQDDFTEPKMKNRILLTVRNAGTFTLCIYTDLASQGKLFVAFADNSPAGNRYYFGSSERIVPGQPVTVAVTWDGERVKVYIDGVLQDDVKQPVPFPTANLRHVFIGPYKDGWYDPAPWGDDSYVGFLGLYTRVLTPSEIIELAGVHPVTTAKAIPPVLMIPRIDASGLQPDGKLTEAFWSAAASMPALVDGTHHERGWRLPPTAFRMAYDEQNLYLGFYTRFPDVPADAIREGEKRTATREPEVWGSESFEFYIKNQADVYRFGGNVAGGTTESRNNDVNYNAPWKYFTSLGLQIDNTRLWQGEVVIPWQSIGLTAPPKEALSFNFCRSWFLPEVGTYSSILEDGEYQKFDRLVPLICKNDTPVMRVTRQTAPDFGKLEQNVELSSPVDATVTYKVDVARGDGAARPYPALEKTFQLAAGKPIAETVEIPLERPGYDRLIFTLADAQGRPWMRQIAPFALNEEFAELQNRFTRSQLICNLRQTQLRAKFGAALDPQLRIVDPAGRVILRRAAGRETRLELPFERKQPAGTYQFELTDGNGKILFQKEFFYPGIGEWENPKPDNRIIFPYTALEAQTAPGTLDAAVWGRRYRWENSIFPAAVTSQDRLLLNTPVTLSANGREFSAGKFTPGATAPHRAEYAVELQNTELTVSGDGWIEYDGVVYQKFKLHANRELNNVALKLTLPAALVKYLHTSAATGGWGLKLTEKVKDGERVFPYYPVIWLGDEEGGLCFFTETRKHWNSSVASTCRLTRDGKNAVLEIRMADRLAAGETLPFEFGLLASPVKALPENYPLNMFGDHYAVTMNRPNMAPVQDAAITYISARYEISECFWDLPTPESSVQGKMGHASAQRVLRNGSRPVPYHQARYLSDEYPEVRAFENEWKIMPETTLDYMRNGIKHKLYDCCPATAAADFYVWKYRQMLKRYPELRGLYFDFSTVSSCSNAEHGCSGRVNLLAQRDFYRKIALAQLDAGIRQPLLVLHNTDSVQLPAMTFATHLLNGEQIRQHSSTILHNGKDILDTYDETMFASELSSLPFGLTNSAYHPQGPLLPEFGGTGEDPELYSFRTTLAMLTGCLVHGTMPSNSYCHYGLFDKVVRFYDAFGVPKAHFWGYWRHPAKVIKGKNIFVSVYRHAREPKLLAVISHIGKEHEAQDVEIAFDLKKLDLKSLTSAEELFTRPDPDYQWLDYAQVTKDGFGAERVPLKLGDFGVKNLAWNGMELNLELGAHKVALVELH